ncbi:H-NS family nucleoid-associated regulatory protein [Idiomarina sp. Sol25]|uniref:H-NS family histone-like protein n=1 Tax=Idiomarina sp. Sol25 TaxID=3064000 RepID=UPI00294AABCD|nr:H-NS family nucleoid-associated regulatory protein [Idiomarina sp. Sol25]MDV6326621.1 H-NS family nucleoid-associated regulatory protein [Idiomarina sp. Sol25]
MSEVINILRHERRLKAALKELDLNELESIKAKLDSVISQRREEEAEKQRKSEAKQKKINEFKNAMADAGIELSDILEQELGGEPIVKTTRKKRAPKPPKYEYTDENGEKQTWTGQGRMPKAIKTAVDSGTPLERFLIK